MRWETWSFFLLTEIVLCITPGPAVLFVLSQALGRGPAKSLWGSAGILAANAGCFALSATSLGAIIIASYRLFRIIKWLGAAYVICLGVQSLRARRSILKPFQQRSSDAPNWRTGLDGFLLQGANPKALLFFTAILPQFTDARHPIAPQLLILGATSLLVEFTVLTGYGRLAGAVPVAANPRLEIWTNRLAGSFLVAAGLGLAGARRA